MGVLGILQLRAHAPYARAPASYWTTATKPTAVAPDAWVVGGEGSPGIALGARMNPTAPYRLDSSWNTNPTVSAGSRCRNGGTASPPRPAQPSPGRPQLARDTTEQIKLAKKAPKRRNYAKYRLWNGTLIRAALFRPSVAESKKKISYSPAPNNHWRGIKIENDAT